MERTGTVPTGALDASDLQALYLESGPFVSVALGTPGAEEQAAQKNLLRWEALRGDLETSGAEEAALDAVAALVPEAHLAGEGLFAVARGEKLLLVHYSPAPPRWEYARHGALPSLAAVLDWRQHQPRYLVVLADHSGADVMTSGHDVTESDEEIRTEDRYPLSRNAPGGWSQRRYQQHAVENWSKNAAEVAQSVATLFERVRPEIVLLGGDPRSVEMVEQALPRPVTERVRKVRGNRAADGGGDATASEVARLVETQVARDTVGVLEEFRQHLGREDRAVDGAEATLVALRESRVSVLLVHFDPQDRRTGWLGAEPGLAALNRRDLAGVGGGDPVEGPLVDVAVAAAISTGALLRLVPSAGGPTDGLGALLRWTD